MKLKFRYKQKLYEPSAFEIISKVAFMAVTIIAFRFYKEHFGWFFIGCAFPFFGLQHVLNTESNYDAHEQTVTKNEIILSTSLWYACSSTGIFLVLFDVDRPWYNSAGVIGMLIVVGGFVSLRKYHDFLAEAGIYGWLKEESGS